MNFRSLLFIPPIAAGIAGFIWMTNRPAPEIEQLPETAVVVRVQTVEPRQMSSTAIGFGRVEAAQSWSAISEIEGRIVEEPEGLDVGSIVEKGQSLIAIDRTDYELSRQKSLANMENVVAQLAELARQEENSQSLLAFETRILEVAQAEFERVQALLERGTGTQAAVDTAQKALLAQETSLASLNNTLALYPAQRASLEATLAVRQAELKEVERSLEKTKIVAPFRGRVAEINADLGQFIRTGDSLITLEGTKTAEVVAEIQPRAFSSLMFGGPQTAFLSGQVFETSQFTSLMQEMGIAAKVTLSSGELSAEWPAEIVRLRGTMDSETGAMGIVVQVTDPLQVTPGLARPPLHAGTFVSVVLTAEPRDKVIAIPRHAVHLSDDGQPFVYLANDEDRLKIKDIEIGQVIGSDILVREGLVGSEILVLGSPRPPVPGLKLTLVDTSSQQQDK
ncbi:HlyD family efflux transporter periplasmic adaptor subunit [uncultured Pelagimonas sp.]|uniref:efflux RND transporter periplasmic adaptor subunit n=1 Tax=uncultured Pelagimonas sp. TaxID=1618102 RepID=UPI002636F776|nr:HlyD family efflux transporter periplasmic adaptor subunit [uncultured Pelagimonas sp.]